MARILRKIDLGGDRLKAALLDAQERAMPGLRAVYAALPSGPVDLDAYLEHLHPQDQQRRLRALDSLSALGLVVLASEEA